MKRILFDCDDVLLDWLGGFRSFIETHHGIVPDHPAPLSWDMEAWLGGRNPRPLIEEFNTSHHFAKLEPVAGAVEAVTTLHRRGWWIGVLTSCTVQGGGVEISRMDNLQSHFGRKIQQTWCLPLGSSKRVGLNLIAPGVYVEDNLDHAISAVSLGIKTFMVRRPHNLALESSAPLMKWVDNLPEMVSHLP